MDEAWKIAFGYIGQEPATIRCSEEEVDTLSREIQAVFGPTSNWKISATRVRK